MIRFVTVSFLASMILAACTSFQETPAAIPTAHVVIVSTTEISMELFSVDCMTLATTQPEMNQCASQKQVDSQQKLDQLVEELQLKYQATEQGPAFARVQNDWETLKEEDCSWQTSFLGDGSVRPMLFSLCILKRNSERVNELKIFLCDGAGMTGPCEASKRYDEVAGGEIPK